MLVSLYIFSQFHGITNVDPGRIPAQVISGIGFLGAGTIIIEGLPSKTYYSGQFMGSIGHRLAVGVFYYGAVVSTFLILLTLIAFNKLEWFVLKRNFTAFNIVG